MDRLLELLSLLIAAGEGCSKYSKPNCLKFLICLKYVKTLLEDSDSSLVLGGAVLLENALEEARVLMETSGSKIYRVWRCQLLTVKFEDVTLQIEHAIGSIFTASSHRSYTQAGNCLSQLRRTNYFVDISDERLAEEIEVFLLQLRSGGIAIEKLRKLASKLDIRCNNTLAKELEALEKEEQNAKSLQEKKQVRDLIALFSRLQTSAASSEVSKQDNMKIWGVSVPADFRCPLSLELMMEPVIVASGQTYERSYIQTWLDQGNSTCPKTRQALSHDNLIPNYTVKALINSWCESNNIALPETQPFDATAAAAAAACSSTQYSQARPTKCLGRSLTTPRPYPVKELGATMRRYSFQESVVQSRGAASQAQVEALVAALTCSSADRRAFAAAEIRLLAKNNTENRILFAQAGVIKPLIALLGDGDHKQLQENAVTALLNLSINDNNKAEIAQAGAIQPLVNVLKLGTPVAMENAAATLFSLSVVEDNKAVIGAAGAISPLVDLLASGSPRGKKDAATALFNLSISHDNKARIVKAGAVRSLVELISEPALGMVDKAVAILANLSTTPEGRVAIGEQGGISALVEVVEAGSPRGKENAAAALLHLCVNSNKHRALVLQEGAIPPLHALSQTGTPRGKEKALGLLKHFREQRCK